MNRLPTFAPTSALPWLAASGLVAASFAYACEKTTETTAPTSSTGLIVTTSSAGGAGGAGGQATTAQGGAGGEGINLTVGTGGNGTGGSCADAVVEAQIKIKPADIIFIIDNSGSMSEEIAAVESNISNNFAQIIGNSGIDYRVIMLADHGSGSLDVCIEQPLSTIPLGGCATIGNNPPGENPGKFYHYDLNIQSWDSTCLALDSLFGTGALKQPENTLNPEGWSKWLRPEAVKIFVEISDDRVNCNWTGAGKTWTFNDQDNYLTAKQTALDIDSALLAYAPQHFGSTAARNYIWYSIVGLQSKNLASAADTLLPIDSAANPLDPFGPFEPVTKDKCTPGAVNSGLGYQWLSKGTGGLRFPLCNPAGYGAVFNDIAAGVVEGATVPCEMAIPKPKDPNVELDLKTLTVLYTPGDMSMAKELELVASEGACGLEDDKFYIDEVNQLIKLCPKACALVESDDKAKVQVKVECGGDAF